MIFTLKRISAINPDPRFDTEKARHEEQLFKEIEIKIWDQEAQSFSPVKHTPKFRFNDNERQFKCNWERRIVVLENYFKLIDKYSLSIAIQFIEKSIKTLKKKNKILWIAVKYGSDVVDEYTDDPITEGIDDATKLRQAEYRAKTNKQTIQSKNMFCSLSWRTYEDILATKVEPFLITGAADVPSTYNQQLLF